MNIKDLHLIRSLEELRALPEGKLLINTINAHSFNTAQHDTLFREALLNGDALIPDGMSIVKACRWLNSPCQPKERIAGWDLFQMEMERLNSLKLEPETLNLKPVTRKVMFLGSSEDVLTKIKVRALTDYPNLEVVTYSPPYVPEFSEQQTAEMVNAINAANPDLLWIGMTAPKQEKWTYQNWSRLNIHCHVGTIGAVFNFYAGTVQRAPQWWQNHGLEWLYRLLKEPRRMWRRYILGNTKFLYYIAKEKIFSK